ncbi:MAG: 4-oxalocrotonate tautomerase family protein [Methanosarcinaceae archaeon]|nr:4-oxalocrotonate tautomerase family protein [Methanosarcinaceae archaeon]
MPLIEVTTFENEFSEDEKKEIIKAMTDTMVSFSGENLRSATWVVIREVKSGSWGIGGKALGLQDVRALQASK